MNHLPEAPDPRDVRGYHRALYGCLLSALVLISMCWLFLPAPISLDGDLPRNPLARVPMYLIRPYFFLVLGVAWCVAADRYTSLGGKAMAALVVAGLYGGVFLLPPHNPVRNTVASAVLSLLFMVLSAIPLLRTWKQVMEADARVEHSAWPLSQERLAQTAASLRRSQQRIRVCVVAFFVFLALALPLIPFLQAGWLTPAGIACIACLALMVASLAAIGLLYGKVNAEAEDFGRTKGYRDVKSVGHLVDVMQSTENKGRQAARKALTRLLPQLKASDSHRLDERHRAFLCRQITPENAHKEPRFAIAVVRAMEQVGATDALPAVEKLAQERDLAEELQEAARSCREYLLLQVEKERESRTLLRPIETTTQDAMQLLRPAPETEPTEADRLLRPTSPESRSDKRTSRPGGRKRR